LETWRKLSESGEADAVTATRAINGLRERIKVKEDEIEAAALPSVLRGKVGPQAGEIWAGLDLSTKRAILRACCTFRVAPNGRGRVNVPVSDVVDWRWLIGPEECTDEDWPFVSAPPTLQQIITAWFAEHGELKTTAEVREFFASQPYRPTPKSLSLRLGRMAREGILLRPKRGHFTINPSAIPEDLSQAR
jgi:hypothetical protein